MQESQSIIGQFFTLIASLIFFAIMYSFFAALFGLLISFLLRLNLQRIPAEHRKMDPEKVWYGAIPFYNAYLFFQFTEALSASYKSYFDSVGDNSVGDCGRQTGQWFCIAFAVSYIWIVPVIHCLGALVSLAMLVLLIIYLIKIFELRNKIPETPGGGGAGTGSGMGSTPGGAPSSEPGPAAGSPETKDPGAGAKPEPEDKGKDKDSSDNPPGYRPS